MIGALCPEAPSLLGLVSVLGPAMAMGNACVLVPSHPYSLAATDFAQVLDTSDVPGGVVNIVTGDPAVLGRALAGHMDVDAVWNFASAPGLSAQIEADSAGNLKRTWVNHGRPRDWSGLAGEGPEFLRAATETRTVWVPYGE